MTKVSVGDIVYVPAAKLGSDDPNAPILVKCKVLAHISGGRKARVETLQGSTATCDVATRHILKNAPDVLVLRIGDFATELSQLNPLAESIRQFFRLLIPDDDHITLFHIRSLAEFSQVWKDRSKGTSYLVLISHGGPDALKFGIDGSVTADALAASIGGHPPPAPVTVLSLACRTGYARFARELSKSEHIDLVVAPYHDVNPAIACHFLQSFFAHHFVTGSTKWLAFKAARKSTPDGTHFRCWSEGKQL